MNDSASCVAFVAVLATIAGTAHELDLEILLGDRE